VPGTTATQGLIYPVDGDRACDGALQIEVLAKGINARYVILDASVGVAENPLMCFVEWTAEDESAEPLQNLGIVWNTVQVDDAEAYDAAIAATYITLPYTAPGDLWEIGAYVEGQWDAVSGGVEQVVGIFGEITSATGVPLWQFENNGPSVRPIHTNSAGVSLVLMHETTSRDTVRVTFSTFNDGPKLEFAQLWAIRVSEV
jgi:hypothetical protein